MRVINTISNFIKARTVTNKICVTDDHTHNAKKALMEFLLEIETRVKLLPSEHENQLKFNGMQISMGRQLAIAATDWSYFCTLYDCTMGYNSSLKESECFYLYIKEKTWPQAPADWEVRFINLSKIKG